MPPGAAAAPREQLAAPARLQKLRQLARKPSAGSGLSAGASSTTGAGQSLSERRDPRSGTATVAVAAGNSIGSGGSGAIAADSATSEAARQETLAHAARLEGANAQLRERLAEALDELNAAHAQLRILQDLQRQLEDATPGAAELVEAALQQERALQAARDAQVLQLLRAKDEVIESFEARYAESRAEAAQHKEQLGVAQEQLEGSQLRVRELVESKTGLRKKLDQAAAAAVDAEAELRGEIERLQGEAAACEPLRRQVLVLERQLADARADLSDAHGQLHTLADTVDAANAAIMEVQAMLTEREEAVARKEAEVQDLQCHLAQLLGMPQADARIIHQAQYKGPVTGQADARIAALEAANERLEAALVEATRSAAAATGGLPAERSTADSDADAVGELTAQLAVTTGKLRAAEERVEQLEKLLKVAEATVLHNEVQLQESLEGRMCAEEQVHSLRLAVEDSQALLQQLKAKLDELTAGQQAAQQEAAGVRSRLAAAMQQRSGLPMPAVQQEGGSQPADGAVDADSGLPRAPGITASKPSGSLDREVEAALGSLLHRISDLETQLTCQQEAAAAAAAAVAAAAAAQQQAAAPEQKAAGVQCDLPAQASAAVQVEPVLACPTADSSTQTHAAEPAAEGGGAGSPHAEYGRPDARQQQVAELTAQLAAARLAEVTTKADAEAKLLEAERMLEEQMQHQKQVDARCSMLQARVEELEHSITAAQQEGDTRLAQAVADAQAQQQALEVQLAAVQGTASELRELRSSAYATVHRLRQALLEQGAVPSALPDGCEPGALPQQLKQAVDQLLSMLQEHGELVAAFQQHMQQDAGLPGATPGSSGDMLLEAQRAVIRSLAAQVARLGQAANEAGTIDAAGSPVGMAGGLAHAQQPALPAIPALAAGDAETLVGTLSLLKQQLASLDRVQQQMEAAQSASSPAAPSPAASSGGSSLLHNPHAAHAAALLGTELPALHATLAVMEGELRRMAAQAATRAAAPASSSSPGAVLCLPASAAAPASAAGTTSEAATAAAAAEAKCRELQAKLDAAERLAAEQVATLQARVQDLAAAGSQLEGVLQETAQQLLAATDAAEQEQRRHAEAEQRLQAALAEAKNQLVAADAALEEQRQQHDGMAARLEGLEARVQGGDAAEDQLRSQLQELAEQVAVLTAAQKAARSEVELKQQALIAAQQELEAVRVAHAALAAEKQQREAALAGRLAAVQDECCTLLGVVEQAEEQQTAVELRMQAQLAALSSQLAHLGDDASAQLPSLSSGLTRLQQLAEAWEVRLLRLELQAAVAWEDRQEAAAARWATLIRGRRYRAAVKALRDGLQCQLLDAQAACQQQAAQLTALQGALEAAQREREEAVDALQSEQLQHQHDLQRVMMCDWQQELAALRHEAEEEQQRQKQQAEAATKEAVTAVEERCRVEAAARACQLEQRAIADLEAAEQQCSEVQAQLDAVRAEFQRYQAIKSVEIRLLEQRVLRQFRGSSNGSNGAGGAAGANAGLAPGAAEAGTTVPADASSAPVTVADLEAACCHEGIDAALREARLERLQRQQLEQELAAAQQAGEQLAATKVRQGAEVRTAREKAERLAAELSDYQSKVASLEQELREAQAALRLAKGEGSRRLKELQALQAATSENSGPNVAAQLEGEQEARKAAEAKLHEARQMVARKTELVKDLRAKVASLERQLAAQDPAPLAAELDACHARLRQAQAACGSKDAAMRELRERLEQQTRLARQQGMLEEREVQQGQLGRLGQELAERDVQLADLHRQLRQMHQELAAATAGLQEAAASHSAEAQDAAARLVEAQQCVQQLMQTLRLLLETLVQLGAAVAAVTEQGSAQADADALAAAAGDLAGLVDLSPDDIGAVLLPGGSSAGIPGSSAMDAAARQAWAALEQLEAQATEQRWQQTQACAAQLQAAIGGLQERCLQVAVAMEAHATGCREDAALAGSFL